MRLVFHVPCPSCGLTRAARCLLHLDFAGATHMHPLWWLVFPCLGAVVAVEATRYVRTGKVGALLDHHAVQRLAGLLVVALLVVWVARGLGAFGGPVSIE